MPYTQAVAELDATFALRSVPTSAPAHLAASRFFTRLTLLAGAWLFAAWYAPAASLPALRLERSADDLGRFSRLQWPSEPGFLYRLQTATNLSAPGGDNENWHFGDALVADSTNAMLELRGRSIPENSVEFYRLAGPTAEIFSVEPAWIDSSDPNAALYLTGQGLPTNATVIINSLSFAATNDPSGALRVALVGGALPGGSIISSALRVIDNATSNVVATWEVQSPIYYGTEWTREQLQGPAAEPPVSPLGSFLLPVLHSIQEKAKAPKSQARVWFTTRGGDDRDDDCDGFFPLPVNHTTSATKSRSNIQNNRLAADGGDDDCDGVFAATGEVRCQETDFVIPGAGLDFVWTRTYRSRTGPTTAQGARWDFAYNVSLAQNGDGTLTLRPGNGREDTFYPDGTNGWIRDEYFVEVRDLNGDSFPDVLFPDTGKWLFNPPGAPAGGKLARIIDRNGNTIAFGYDGAGRLATIVDDLGRTNTVAYNPIGLVQSVTDFTGRAVRYEYDGNGNLRAVVSPPVSGFPGGITNRYTYSHGYANDAENHLLLSVIDGQGQVRREHAYQHNQSDWDFLRCISVRRGTNPPVQFSYLPVAPASSQGFATTRTIMRDGVGNVSESYFDSRQRCVRWLAYTGRAPDLNLPTTGTENRPTGKLRAADPDYFETHWAWNPDSLCTLEIRPDGSRTEIVHQRVQDHNSSRSNKTASRRHEGNVRVVRERAGNAGGGDLDGDGAPDFTELVWRFEYDPRFGSPPSRAQDHNSSRSNKTASKSSVQDHNSSRSNKTASALDIDDPGDEAGPPGPLGFAVNTRGAAAQSGKAKGGMKIERGWVCSAEKRGPNYLPDEFADFAIAATDPRGQVMTAEYDAGGNRVRIRSQHQGDYLPAHNFKIEIDAVYNSRGQLTAITNAADASGYRREDTFSYHASGPQAGYLEAIAIDEPGVHLTSRFEYDARGNLTRYVDPRTNDWLFNYNALNQCIRIESPVNAGAREAREFVHAATGEVQEVVSELRDGSGVLIHSVTNRFERDSLNRCTAVIRQVLPGSYITNRFDYDANDHLVAVRSPLAVSGADPHAVVHFEHDERGLLFRQITAPGSPLQDSTQFDYDPARRLLRVTEALETEPRVTSFAYDGLPRNRIAGGGRAQGVMGQKAKSWMVNNYEVHSGYDRLTGVIDPMGNETRFNYDRAGNLTRVRCYGETNDVPGSAGNRLLAETRYSYDSFDRCVLRWKPFFDVFTGAPIGDGGAATTFTYAPNGDCTSVTDDNGHTTRFGYDTAGRRAAVTSPGGKSVLTCLYDPAGNAIRILRTDTPNLGGATQVFARDYRYDSLNRLVADSDNVGNTNRYAYDSLGRCVLATDPRGNDSVFVYDDLGRGLAVTNFAGSRAGGITINTSHVEYDVNDRCVVTTDGNNNTTGFMYDSLGNCTRVTRADGSVCHLVWSPRSNLLRIQDPNGTIITNTCDLLDRCARRDIIPGAGVAGTTTFERFAYDGASRLVSAVNDASTNAFAYDSLGNRKTVIRDGWQMLGLFDTVGNCLALTYPSGRIVNYTYDALDQVKTVSASAGGGLPPATLATFDYEGPGRLSQITRANGVDTRVQWNGLVSPPNATEDFGWRQVSGVSHRVAGGGAILDRRLCAYDRNQNKTARAQTTPFLPGGPAMTNLLAYDALDRLISFTRVPGTPEDMNREYQLDPNGNRQVVFVNGVPQVYTMDAKIPPGDFQMNQYTTTPSGPQKFDENGNLATRGTALGAVQYVYDFANRLVAVNDLGTGAPLATYAYDALGRRIARTVFPAGGQPPVTTDYIHGDDDGDGVVEEYTGGMLAVSHVSAVSSLSGAGGGAASAAYAATGRIIATIGAGGQAIYLLNDDLGSTLALTDPKGNVIERYDYADYGWPAFLTSDGSPLMGSDGQPAVASAAGNAFLFHGLQWEPEPGFYHLPGGSYFDPQTGQTICGLTVNGGMPNRISMNVTVPKQTQGATFGERVNAGLHAAGSAVAQGASLLGNNPWTLKKEEGGRHTPFHNPYRPSFRSLGSGRHWGTHITLIKSNTAARETLDFEQL